MRPKNKQDDVRKVNEAYDGVCLADNHVLKAVLCHSHSSVYMWLFILATQSSLEGVSQQI